VTSLQETENGNTSLRVSSSDSDGRHPSLDEDKVESSEVNFIIYAI